MMWQLEAASNQSKADRDSSKWKVGVLKPEVHSHNQVEWCKVLPQHVASWVDGGLVVSIYNMWHVYVIYMCSVWKSGLVTGKRP
jgi:hypothetical protein